MLSEIEKDIKIFYVKFLKKIVKYIDFFLNKIIDYYFKLLNIVQGFYIEKLILCLNNLMNKI